LARKHPQNIDRYMDGKGQHPALKQRGFVP